MTREELEAARERSANATPGPWRVGTAAPGLHIPWCSGRDCYNVWAQSDEDGGIDVTTPCARLSHQDAEFIAAARQDVPALLAYIDRLETQVNTLEGLLADAALDLGRR